MIPHHGVTVTDSDSAQAAALFTSRPLPNPNQKSCIVTKPPRSFQQRQAPPAPPPPGLHARLVAASVLADVAGQGSTLDERLGAEASARMSDLDPRDRALVRSITTVALRRLGAIRAALARFLEKGLPKNSTGSGGTALTVRGSGCFRAERRSRKPPQPAGGSGVIPNRAIAQWRTRR